MWRCKKCNGYNIVSNLVFDKIVAGNDYLIDKPFGKIDICIQVCWCADCGEPCETDVLSIYKTDENHQ